MTEPEKQLEIQEEQSQKPEGISEKGGDHLCPTHLEQVKEERIEKWGQGVEHVREHL